MTMIDRERSGSARGLSTARGAGLTNGSGVPRGRGLTNGGGFTNGSGRTNGSGFTNGSGRTNGSGFTNGSGRTNGSAGRVTGAALHAAARAAKRRGRRRTAASIAVVLLLTVSLAAALGLSGAAPDGPAFDGSLAEWAGALQPAPPSAVLAQFAVADGPAGPAGAFVFLAPLEGRADVWVFLDTDSDGSTGFWSGAVGADMAVVVRLDGGRSLSAASMRFTGDDAFDLNGLKATGPAAAASHGASLEVSLPALPAALSVAVATLAGADATVGFDLQGQAVLLHPAGLVPTGTAHNGVLIDGDFSDWEQVPKSAEPSSPALPGRLDIVSAAAIGDEASAQFYVDAREGIMMGTLPLRATPVGGPAQEAPSGAAVPAPPLRVAGTDLLEVYLDLDHDVATGAMAFGLGAEYMLRVEGTDGRVVAAQAFAFDGGWTAVPAAAEAAAADGALEASFDVPGLTGADARFVLKGFEGALDVSQVPLTVGALSGGAAAPEGTVDATGAPAVPLDLNPIPELADMAAVAAGVFVLFVVARRRRLPTA
jgi:hypothetical protein